MKIFFDVVGCRLNQSEVERLANIFYALGHEIVRDPSIADFAIINTCAVTVKAAADSRKKLRRAAREGAKDVIATGCWASLYPDQTINLPGVTGFVSNQEKENLVSLLLDTPPEQIEKLTLKRIHLPGQRGRTRAFIKVQEGCDNHCTYCLTRIARGRSQSKTVDQIKRDIQVAIDGDAKEIVLSGVQLGAWGKDFPDPQSLKVLISSLLSSGGFERLRLSSIEPWDFEPDLLSLWSDDRLCRHFHIPLQSGDDEILTAMGRPITTDGYRALVEEIQTKIPGSAITTDVITGFPGEGESAFIHSLDFIRSIGFAGGHVFTFSPRPGTAAAKMIAQVPFQLAKKRNQVLRKTFQEQGNAFRDRFVGENLPVLWESSEEMTEGSFQLSGLTDNYIRVFANASLNLWNEISDVELLEAFQGRNALMGRIL